MRVTLDLRTATDHFPGIGRYALSLAGALAELAPETDLQLLFPVGSDAARLSLLPDRPVIPCPASPFSLGQQWQVPRLLRSTGATLYHSPYYLMPYWPGLPTVLTVHDFIPLVCPGYYTTLQRLIYRAAHSLALRTAAAVIVDSAATRGDLLRFHRVDPARVVTIPLAAGSQFRPPAAAAIMAVGRQYRLPPGYALFLASNKPHKNLLGLVRAWPGVLRRRPGAHLVVAGHWDARFAEPAAAVEALGLAQSVTFLGPVAERDLPALYAGADVFVFPSYYEGFGLPVLEAMACGAPVICSDRSSLPEVAGAAAVLVDPDDGEALAEAIAGVLADPDRRDDLRRRGLAQAATFSWSRTAAATLAVYERINSRAHLL